MNFSSYSESFSSRTCSRGSSGVCRGDTATAQPVAFLKRQPASSGFLLAAILLALPFVLASPSYSEDKGKKPIRALGAAGVASAVNAMARAYAQEFPQCPSVTVVGSTTEKGFESLMEGNAELVLAHREASAEEIRKAAEKNVVLGHKFLRNSGLAIITSSINQPKDWASPIQNENPFQRTTICLEPHQTKLMSVHERLLRYPNNVPGQRHVDAICRLHPVR